MVSHTENINTIKIDYTQKRKEIKKKMIFLDVRNYIREYNDTTGIQGLHYLTDNKRSSTEKIVWGIILLTSLTGCFWMIYEILQKYLNSPIVIGFANEPGLIHQIPFPAVTICPLNTVSNHKFNYENIKLKLKNITSLTAEERRILYYMRSICSKSASLYKEELNCMLNNKGILDVIEKVAPDPPLVACHFGNEKYNCADIFTRVLTNSGICYSFNVMDRNEVFKNQVFHYKDFHQVGRNSSAFDGESGYKGKIGPNVYPRRALFSRLAHGLYFGLVQRSKDINKFCDPILKGYLMMVHLPSETSASKSINVYSLPLEESLILSITPELTRTSDKIKKFNVEKRKCYLKGEKQLKYYQIYTKSNCETECLTNITLSKCGCVPFYMPRMNGTEFICSLERHNCIDEAERYLYEKAIESRGADSDITNYHIGCNCLPLCTELNYNLDILPYDIHIDKKYLNNASLSAIVIKFKSSSFPILERNELYGTIDLISNFGGLLGLFTGFSFISLAEIIYFLTLRIWCNRRLYGRWSGPPV